MSNCLTVFCGKDVDYLVSHLTVEQLENGIQEAKAKEVADSSNYWRSYKETCEVALRIKEGKYAI